MNRITICFRLARKSHYAVRAAVLLSVVILLVSCSRKMLNLSPDIIWGYGLDQTVLPRVQLYYKSLSIRSDSSVTTGEPTIFRCIEPRRPRVTEMQSPAAERDLTTGDIIVLKNATPCRVVEVLDSGRVLRADFDRLKLDFKLSYQAGYAFELVTDTVAYQGRRYVRSRMPLVRTIGLLAVDRKKLRELRAKEIRVRGVVVPEENK